MWKKVGKNETVNNKMHSALNLELNECDIRTNTMMAFVWRLMFDVQAKNYRPHAGIITITTKMIAAAFVGLIQTGSWMRDSHLDISISVCACARVYRMNSTANALANLGHCWFMQIVVNHLSRCMFDGSHSRQNRRRKMPTALCSALMGS